MVVWVLDGQASGAAVGRLDDGILQGKKIKTSKRGSMRARKKNGTKVGPEKQLQAFHEMITMNKHFVRCSCVLARHLQRSSTHHL